nr:hypothetical protein [Tanacetum cinerariifolium]
GKVTSGLSSLRLADGSCDDGGEVEAASSLSTGAGIEILAIVRYAGCGGGVAADSSISNGSVSSVDGAWSAAVGATTTESAGA